MLFHDMGKPAMKTTDEKGNDHFKGHALESEKIARTVLKRLKFDNETIRIVTKLVCYHDYRMEATPANVRRAMNRIGVELFPYYLAVRLADAKSQSTYMRREKIENIVEIRNLYKQILMENQCVTLRQLAVSGRELMELGMKPGRELGAMLSELLEYVLDDGMFDYVARTGVPYIMMHIQGTPQTMQKNPHYESIVKEVRKFLTDRIACLNAEGFDNIILDPGFGFGKTLAHNYELMNGLEHFQDLGYPLLVGISRKSMIYKLLGNSPAEALNGTAVLNTVSLLKGANILRVHDVREACEAVKIFKALSGEM